MVSASAAEDRCAAALDILRPGYLREYLFAPPRRWRFDFAWPASMLALEVEGGIYGRGRHVRPAGYIGDCAKYNAAALRGWRVLRITPGQISDGTLAALMAACEMEGC